MAILDHVKDVLAKIPMGKTSNKIPPVGGGISSTGSGHVMHEEEVSQQLEPTIAPSFLNQRPLDDRLKTRHHIACRSSVLQFPRDGLLRQCCSIPS